MRMMDVLPRPLSLDPLGLRYEFIEICGGAAVVTKEMIKLGSRLRPGD